MYRRPPRRVRRPRRRIEFEEMPPLPDDPPSAAAAPREVAIRRVFDEHGASLFSLALRFCGDRQDAEDLVQEVLMHAYRGWDSFQGRSSEKTWLYTIAARACQRMHRKRAGEPAHVGSLEELLPFSEPRVAIIAQDQEGPLQVQIRTEARQQVEAAIAALPDEFRIPLILKEIVGFSVPEVAQVLDLQEGTVKSRIHRARLRIRAAVDSALPRAPHPAPPPAYPMQVCLDLLQAKQEALDRGVPFRSDVICERCRSVFSSLDLAQQACRDLAAGALPDGLRERLAAAIRSVS